MIFRNFHIFHQNIHATVTDLFLSDLLKATNTKTAFFGLFEKVDVFDILALVVKKIHQGDNCANIYIPKMRMNADIYEFYGY